MVNKLYSYGSLSISTYTFCIEVSDNTIKKTRKIIMSEHKNYYYFKRERKRKKNTTKVYLCIYICCCGEYTGIDFCNIYSLTHTYIYRYAFKKKREYVFLDYIFNKKLCYFIFTLINTTTKRSRRARGKESSDFAFNF